MQEQVSTLESQLVDAIQESLQNHICTNATFLAERLLAERDCEDYRNLLAECYLAENKPNKAYYILKDCKSEQCRYKFALSCLKINKFKDAEKALTQPETNLRGNMGTTNNRFDNVPNGSSGLYLLGLINERQQKYIEAKDYYKKALELNPVLWSAYERLLKLGQDMSPNGVFADNKYKLYEKSRKPCNSIKQRRKQSEQETLTTNTTAAQRTRRSQNPPQPTNFGSLPQPRSVTAVTTTTNTSQTSIVSLLKRLADPFYNMSFYYCTEAIDQFKKLPPNQLNTGWVQSNIGRCYMQIVKYNEAQKHYAQAYRIEPYRLEGIQYYSSCLWHLKKQVELCFLAQTALERSMYSPQTWIAVGNCFSLQKEHQHALRFFQRAIQLNPHNPYAYSLCGHEHVYNEQFGKAKKMFQNAVNLDMRHYNAWWGIGNIFYKQEKYENAMQSFNKAISINPRNPVLYSFMGMTAAARRQFQNALKLFEKSEQLDPKNGLNRFQKANTLVKLERYPEAIEELEKLQTMMPKQAPIPTLLGKIYKKLGKIDRAHSYFTLALQLESKDAQRIKGYIENLHNTGGDFEEIEM